MFGKLTPEQKAKLATMFGSQPEPAGTPAKPTDASESSGDESDNEQHAAPEETKNKYAADALKLDTESEFVEVTNIRLFDMGELDFATLQKCTTLSLRKNLIHELTPLPLALTQRLVELDFFDNKVRKIRDFFTSATVPDESSPGVLVKQTLAAPFCSLVKLDLSYNQLKHIRGLESLAPTLKELYLVENHIKTVEGLDTLVNLELLELGGNRIRDVGAGLEKLVSLKYLWLGKNKIASLGTSLNALRSLKRVSLQANRIVTISPDNFPDGCNPDLEELYLSENGISTIEHLPLHRLRVLDFSFNPLASINQDVVNVSNMPALEEFWLTDGKVDHWAEVEKLKVFSATLHTVYLERNPIEQDRRYRDKMYLILPFLTQIDSWPIVNKGNLEADRSIQRTNPRD